MTIKKVKRNKQDKLESNHRDGILLHGYIDKESYLFKMWGNNVIGLSMNDRKHFTKEEWDKLYSEGLKMFKEVANECMETN